MKKDFVQPWFDEKYSQGTRPTLEDKSTLLQGLLRSSDRCRREVDEAIKEALFKLRQRDGYTPSLHVVAYELVHSFGPAVSLDEQDLRNYREQYLSALAKHREETVFNENFQK